MRKQVTIAVCALVSFVGLAAEEMFLAPVPSHIVEAAVAKV